MHSATNDTKDHAPEIPRWNSHHPPLIAVFIANATAIESTLPPHRGALHALSVVLIVLLALLALDVDTRRRDPMSARGRLVVILTVLLALPALCTTTGQMVRWAVHAITPAAPAPGMEPAPPPRSRPQPPNPAAAPQHRL